MLTQLPQGEVAEVVIVLPFDKPPLTLNNITRMHRMEKGRHTATLREIARLSASNAKLPRKLPHVWVEFVYRAPNRRRQDSDNLAATTKPLHDGLVDFGLVADDTPQYMTKLPEIIIAPDDPRMPTLPRGKSALIISWELS